MRCLGTVVLQTTMAQALVRISDPLWIASASASLGAGGSWYEKRMQLGDRSQFSTLEARAYLNHAAIGATPDSVVAAMHEAAAAGARHGLDALWDWRDTTERTKAAFADLIGADADEIAFVANTTMAVTTIALCFRWEAGDRVVVFDGEFPANRTPWERAADLFGLELVCLDSAAFADDGPGEEMLEAELRRGVRMVAVSTVQFATGLWMPMARIGAMCRRHGARLFTDAIQAVGVVPVDAADSDFLACGAHKWLMGPYGLGVLHLSRERWGDLAPHLAGWLSHEESLRFLTDGPGHLEYGRPLLPGPLSFEGGAPNVIAQAGLEAALALTGRGRIADVLGHVQAYHDALEPALVDLGFVSSRTRTPSQRSGSLSVRPPDGMSVPALARTLKAAGFLVSTPDGWLRFSPSWPNSLDEIPELVAAVRAAL